VSAMLTADLFGLRPGQMIPKRILSALIQYSKQPGSPHWSGAGNSIGNTPQQGINWIGSPPAVRGVIIKTLPGSYAEDGWADSAHETYRYSFKARKGRINPGELANRVLIDQPTGLYPLLLFTEAGLQLRFEGRFDVSQIAETYVLLRRQSTLTDQAPDCADPVWREGRKRYVTHLLAERSGAMAAWLKSVADPVCDICGDNPSIRYGARIIDAHHRTPISTWTEEREVTADEIALLCPNCHRAVHARMREDGSAYDAIRLQLRNQLAPPA
jgi:putative restriction endonuclease